LRQLAVAFPPTEDAAPPQDATVWSGARHARVRMTARPPRRRGPRPGLLLAFVLIVPVALALLLLLGQRAYFAWTALVPAPGGRYVEATLNQPNALNPLLATTDPVDREWLPLLFAG